MTDDIRERLRAKVDAPPEPPIDATRAFLQAYVSDATSMESVREDVHRMVGFNPRTVQLGLSGIERLLAESFLPPGTLVRLVEIDGNLGLADPTDTGAREWLGELAEMLRKELAG